MTEERAMTTTAPGAFALPDEGQFRRDFQAIARFQAIVRSQMVEGHDYGIIPGTGTKPTLLKPGAEKIAKLLGLADCYELVDRQEDWDKGFFRYLVRCRLMHIGSGSLVSEGLGECNSMESKYRWRDAKRKCPACGKETIIKGKAEYGGGWLCFGKLGGCGAKYQDGESAIEGQPMGRVPNDDIYSLVNTILKMAKKRALVDASLSAGRLSDIFTQDIEDMPQQSAPEAATPAPAQPARQQVSTPAATPPPADAGELAGQGKPAPAPSAPASAAAPRPDDGSPSTEQQRKAVLATAKKAGLSVTDLNATIQAQFKVAGVNDLTRAQASSLIADFQKMTPPEGA